MKPQRPQRNTLRTHKECLFKDITEKIISCAIEVHSSSKSVDLSESRKSQSWSVD